MAEDITIHYEKSRHFRVIHADGAYGGVAPSGYLHFALYNDRFPLPKVGSIPIDDNQKVTGPEVPIERKTGVFREVEADVIMDLPTALGFSLWLYEKAKEMARQGGMDFQALEDQIKSPGGKLGA
ncbi:hypothetical protein QN224_13380 [Sinorhizobium sp. 8-89]|uniref:hypothetical protein n=1 Tax=Sinorhizobium sp. 7-81 TaxID=3049087 RepID=UPI0024C39A77|nr:hypothetical protein [Sinorhizobium sp. 7-81]MDK1386402.1 hypothetical protein [Sinorhizobium sp. 7-81]